MNDKQESQFNILENHKDWVLETGKGKERVDLKKQLN